MLSANAATGAPTIAKTLEGSPLASTQGKEHPKASAKLNQDLPPGIAPTESEPPRPIADPSHSQRASQPKTVITPQPILFNQTAIMEGFVTPICLHQMPTRNHGSTLRPKH